MCRVIVLTHFRKGDAPQRMVGELMSECETEGVALQSNAVEGADYSKVVGKGDFRIIRVNEL